MKAVIASLVLCLAQTADAGPITASVTGCVTALAAGARWTTSDPAGFVTFAAHDMEAGCEPTIRNPTDGVYRTGVDAGGYFAEVEPEWLPKCGRVQIDVQGYTPTGLDASQLHTLVFNTGIDCLLGGDRGEGGSYPASFYAPATTPMSTTPTPIPEPSTWFLLAAGLCLLRAVI